VCSTADRELVAAVLKVFLFACVMAVGLWFVMVLALGGDGGARFSCEMKNLAGNSV
jgi:hypothetical protein